MASSPGPDLQVGGTSWDICGFGGCGRGRRGSAAAAVEPARPRRQGSPEIVIALVAPGERGGRQGKGADDGMARLAPMRRPMALLGFAASHMTARATHPEREGGPALLATIRARGSREARCPVGTGRQRLHGWWMAPRGAGSPGRVLQGTPPMAAPCWFPAQIRSRRAQFPIRVRPRSDSRACAAVRPAGERASGPLYTARRSPLVFFFPLPRRRASGSRMPRNSYSGSRLPTATSASSGRGWRQT